MPDFKTAASMMTPDYKNPMVTWADGSNPAEYTDRLDVEKMTANPAQSDLDRVVQAQMMARLKGRMGQGGKGVMGAAPAAGTPSGIQSVMAQLQGKV